MIPKFIHPKMMAAILLILVSTILFCRFSGNFEEGQNVPGDFMVYERASQRIQTNENPYVQTDASPYKYSPAALVAFSRLPSSPSRAWMIFKFLCVLSFAGAVWFGGRWNQWKDSLLLAIGLALSWKGLAETLDYGQLEFALFFCCVFAAICFQKKHFVSGIILGLLPWLKLPWAFMILPFGIASLMKKDFKHTRSLIFGGLVGAIGIGCGLPMLVFGPERTLDLTRSWLDLLAHQPDGLFYGDLNQSIWSSVSRWTHEFSTLGWVIAIFAGIACVGAFFFLLKDAFRTHEFRYPLANVTPWMIFLMLINPLGWRWGSMLLVGVPFAAKSIRTRWPWAVAAVILYAVQQNPIARAMGFSHWTDLNHYGSITFYWISLLYLCLLIQDAPRSSS